MKNRLNLTRLAELDRQFCDFAKLQPAAAPRCGWTKTVRLALGMSSQALGERLGVSAQGARKLEQAEANGNITLNTLARLAHGLDCEVRYVFVPRTSLVEQVLRRTHEVAGFPMPSVFAATDALTEAQRLQALSVVLAQVNKRGLW
ncbi:putative DNA-binding mobile mystery protein A [Acidovorax sp. 99]|uniref:helix-turn-helix domain-containing protein n=1 Tax=Acidovorax sp. 99 TaxID=2135634 RepID=UPI000D5C6A05|nr:helix-turn-helix domain-containing protein [Acidovorax sp. 99]PVY89377.1 putative DNA-binding mobile mystery protein A [Acidovorax sp. 99]